MAKLTIMVGLARAGKSTYAKKWISNERGNEENRVIINADDFRLATHGQRFALKAEPLVHTIIDITLEVLLKQPLHLLIDETNTSKHSLNKWLRIDPNATFVYIDTPPDVCKQRAYDTNQPDLVEKGVIDRMYVNLQKTIFGISCANRMPTQEEFHKSIEERRANLARNEVNNG